MGTISNTISIGITLAAIGTYSSPLTITASGYVSDNGTKDAIYGPNTQAWTVANYGRVAEFGTYGRYGIHFGDSGLVLNSGTISATRSGVFISGGAATLTNSGVIEGGRSGIRLSHTGASYDTVTNAGTIAGITAGVADSGNGT